jgi:ATP-binding cassette subfamily B (MDR/TAP) protein 1
LFRALFAVLFGAFGVGFAQQLSGDVAKGGQAAISIYRCLDEPRKIFSPRDAKTLDRATFTGKIEFKKVCFKYPSRDQWVFQGLSFTIQPGQHIAFAGASGSGKSTVIQLILRFYDPVGGEILVDGINI